MCCSKRCRRSMLSTHWQWDLDVILKTAVQRSTPREMSLPECWTSSRTSGILCDLSLLKGIMHLLSRSLKVLNAVKLGAWQGLFIQPTNIFAPLRMSAACSCMEQSVIAVLLQVLSWTYQKTSYPRCHYDLKKYFFATQIINTWNSLPESVISASSTDSFKNKLDKFWSNQDLLYNYKAELTGIGSRSFINNLYWYTICSI